MKTVLSFDAIKKYGKKILVFSISANVQTKINKGKFPNKLMYASFYPFEIIPATEINQVLKQQCWNLETPIIWVLIVQWRKKENDEKWKET